VTTTPAAGVASHVAAPTRFRLAETYYVYDPVDAADTGRFARELGALPGVVFVAIAPGEPRPLGALALTILEQLGKDLDRDPHLSQQDAWRLARVWLTAETIDALVVIGAERLDADTWQGLANVRRRLPTPSMILIQHQPTRERDRQRLLDSERDFRDVEPNVFREWARKFTEALKASGDGEAEAPRSARDFPAVPHDDIPFFRAACRDALSTSDFRLVEKAYRRGYDAGSRWLESGEHITEEAAGAFLAAELRWVSDVNEQLTRLRGTQVAFLRRWWLVKVDLEALAAAYSVDPLTAITDDVHARLRTYVQPRTSALAALAIATKLTPGCLAMLNADQIYPPFVRFYPASYGALDLGDRRLALPAARLFLRAHHVDRELRAEPSDGPLFTNSTGKRHTAAAIQQHLRRVMQDTGLPLLAGWSSPTEHEHRHWLHRRGITVQAL